MDLTIELIFCIGLLHNSLVVAGDITTQPKQVGQAMPKSSLSILCCLPKHDSDYYDLYGLYREERQTGRQRKKAYLSDRGGQSLAPIQDLEWTWWSWNVVKVVLDLRILRLGLSKLSSSSHWGQCYKTFLTAMEEDQP